MAHKKCTKFLAVRDDNDIDIKACTACVTEANLVANRSRSASVSSVGSVTSNLSSRAPTPGLTSTSSNVSTRASPYILATIMAKLDKLDSLDSMKASIASIDAKVGAVAANVVALQCEEREVRDITSSLQLRLESTETRLHELQKLHSVLQANHSSLHQEVATLKAAYAFIALKANCEGAADTEEVKALTQEVRHLKVQQQLLEHASELVIGGLPPDNFADLRMAVFAVVSTVYREATVDDILAVRPLRRARSANATASTQLGSTSLLVTQSSPTLARAILEDKIKLRKLHTSQINSELITAAGLRGQLSHTLININEYLPRDLHQLKMRVVAKARDKRYGFQAFVRNGCIFVRGKNEDKSIIINSQEDLAAFLEHRYSTSDNNVSADNSSPTVNSFLRGPPSPPVASTHLSRATAPDG